VRSIVCVDLRCPGTSHLLCVFLLIGVLTISSHPHVSDRTESATEARDAFLRHWRNEPEQNPSIFRAFLKTSWKGLLMATIWNFIALTFAVAGPGWCVMLS
jgi:hypothetical protein